MKIVTESKIDIVQHAENTHAIRVQTDVRVMYEHLL